MKDGFMVDCRDLGAEFVETRVEVGLDDTIGQVENLKAGLLGSIKLIVNFHV